METPITTDDSAMIGNILLTWAKGENIVMSRNGVPLGAFVNNDTGSLVAAVCGAYLAENFPEGEINYRTVMEASRIDPEKAALDEINRLDLFGTAVEIKKEGT